MTFSERSTDSIYGTAQQFALLCRCCVVVLASLFLWGIVPAQAQTNDVLNRINRLENEIDTLNRAVYRGETPPPAAYASPASPSQDSAHIEVRLQQLESDLRTLTGKIEEQSYAIDQIRRQVESESQDALTRIQVLENVQAQQQSAAAASASSALLPAAGPGYAYTPLSSSPGSQHPPATSAPMAMQTAFPTAPDMSDPASLYEHAFSLVKGGDFAAAETAFDGFLKSYPDHPLSPNALYWLGETYYVRNDYDRAAKVFAEGYQKYPEGPKAADNLLKLGMALAGQGKKNDSCIALKQIAIQYPKGPPPVLQRAEQEMNGLGCE